MRDSNAVLAHALRNLLPLIERSPRRISSSGAVLKCLLPVSAVAVLEQAADALEPVGGKIDDIFEQIAEIAALGGRCPTASTIASHYFSNLARQGRIRVRVFRENYRVVDILVGPHAGKSTADSPSRRPAEKPYMIIDAKSLPLRANIPKAQRREPWKPGAPRK